MTSPAQRSTKTGAILFGVAYWVHIHLKPTSMCGINFVGGGGGMSVTNGRKVCIGVLSSDEIGLCGIEHD